MTRFDLRLRHPGGETPIVVGDGVLSDATAGLVDWVAGRRIFVISSAPILELHAGALEPLSRRAAHWQVLEVQDGEEAKSVGVVADLWDRLLGSGAKRDSRVIAFGGGSIGDLAGFAAGCYMRGLDYVQLPTTLLAQVDAAIGGKTAINLAGAKNSVGLFKHPDLVVADTGLLGTLPLEELRSGMIEVVKMAILSDPQLYSVLETELDELLGGDSAQLAPVVAAAARGKVEIVEKDPTEKGERMLLNLGHTLGHAVEAALDYHTLRHGEAVGYGILFAVRLGARRGLPTAAASRIAGLIERFELPPLPALDPEALLRRIGRDKKVGEDAWRWVLPLDVGQCEIVRDLDASDVRRELEAFLTELE